MVFSSAPQPTPPYEDAASTTDRPRLIDERPESQGIIRILASRSQPLLTDAVCTQASENCTHQLINDHFLKY